MTRHTIIDQEAYRRLNAQALRSAWPVREIAERILLSCGVCDDTPTQSACIEATDLLYHRLFCFALVGTL